MSDFRIFTNNDLTSLLSYEDLDQLYNFQKYLTNVRSRFGRDNIPLVSKSEAYLTAWKLGWVDFRDCPIQDLYGLDFEEKNSHYRKLMCFGLEQTAKIWWFNEFNGLIEIPEDWAKIFGKKKK